MNFYKILAACVIAVLSSLVIFYYSGIARSEKIAITHDGVINYHGKINRKNFEKLKRVYEKAKVKPTLLAITSAGGSLMVGIDMGEWLVLNKLSVKVEKYCLSACATFIFPAGKEKYLGAQALLLWHGGAHQANLFEQFANSLAGSHVDRDHEANAVMTKSKSPTPNAPCEFSLFASLTPEQTKTRHKEIETCITHMKHREIHFYNTLGIDLNLPTYGQAEDCRRIHGKQSKGFYYSIPDMEKMGIKNIHLAEGTWQPQLNQLFSELKAFIAKPALLGACSNP